MLGLEAKFNFIRGGEWFGFYLDAGGRSNVEVFLKPAAESSREDQISHLCLEVAGIEDAVAHIRGLGVEVTDKKRGVDETWQAWVTDPNGIPWELYAGTGSIEVFGDDARPATSDACCAGEPGASLISLGSKPS